MMIPHIWVEPELLAEIEYRAKSAEGKVRHPFLRGSMLTIPAELHDAVMALIWNLLGH
jgi:ATP-dependent DNA ligase